ncbi:NAD(P)H-dependent oxidoreductase [Hansschlegelia plantiphila]|uniref:Flavodoxin-like fold domain-containing protein n=1 Tax=Hansschlegelia plantiphila TaxID=374655 RepID=A0A9W6J4R0_9HYPH|nr:NAD(P)H-dependent oxidoreductase [Hansschlegelia plantiphila]GLK69771.1 hypothetical protein GCM10008179_34090 [Hansschlegelia plantiphila]
MKLLHVDAGILGGDSVSRAVSAAMVQRLAEDTPEVEIVRRDLATAPLAHLSAAHLAASGPDAESSAERVMAGPGVREKALEAALSDAEG